MIELDGSFGEGGGQILRSALSLAMCTQTPFRIVNIRAGRKKPGLLRQHLTAVNAAAEVCGADVSGATMGSQTLTFSPGTIRGGNYTFAIGSAGSCTLVFETVLPALLMADKPSRLVLQGGTHNPMAPPFHFLERSFVPLLARMGANVSLTLDRFGFYPAGGGQIVANIQPAGKLTPLHLLDRGECKPGYAEGYIAGVPAHVAKRELACIGEGLGWTEDQLRIRQIHHDEGPGNVLLVVIEHAQATEVFSGVGEKGVTAEAVANGVLRDVRDYLASEAAVGEHLADQLLLPMAMAGTGSFSASKMTPHATSNMDVIGKFLPVAFAVEKREKDWLIRVNA